MKTIQLEKNPTTPDHPVSVSFVPSVDDYVYISRCLGEAATFSRSLLFLYRAFLFLNAICFPVFLIYFDYVLTGLAIFASNLAVAFFLLPDSEKKAQRRFFEKLLKDHDKHICEVALTETGVVCWHNGNETLIAWKNITAIQESSESIYFFQSSNGMAVRKSGFESGEQSTLSVDHARECVRLAHTGQIGKPLFSGIQS